MPVGDTVGKDPTAVCTLSAVLTDDLVENCTVKGQTVSGGDYTGTRFKRVIFQSCRFTDTVFTVRSS